MDASEWSDAKLLKEIKRKKKGRSQPDGVNSSRKRARYSSGDDFHVDSGSVKSKGRGELDSSVPSSSPLIPPKSGKVSITREEQKEKKKARKYSHEEQEFLPEIMQHFEVARGKKATKERNLAINRIFSLMEGDRLMRIAPKHQGSRVIQVCFSHGSVEQRKDILRRLSGHWILLSKGVYSSFLVKAIWNSAKRDERLEITKELKGKVADMIRHKVASDFLETVYGDLLGHDAKLTTSLCQEMWGSEFSLVPSLETPTLAQFLEKHPERRESVLATLKKNIVASLNKGIAVYSFIHHAALEYLLCARQGEMTDMIEVLRDSLIHFAHTRDGSRAFMAALDFASSKNRKVIVKSIRGFVKKIACDEFGSLVLMKILDVVDDTKLLIHEIIKAVEKEMETIATDRYGFRVLLWVLAPRNTKYFPPALSAQFPVRGGVSQESEEVRSAELILNGPPQPTSKKNPEIRRKELVDAWSGSLLDVVESKASVLIGSSVLHCGLVYEILTNAQGDRSSASKAVARALLKDCTVNEKEPAALPKKLKGKENLEESEHSTAKVEVAMDSVQGSRLAKRLISAGDATKNDETLLTFGEFLAKTVKGKWLNFVHTPGSFVLVRMLETALTSEKALAGLYPLRNQIDPNANPGSAILTKMLKSKRKGRVPPESDLSESEGASDVETPDAESD